MALDDTDNRPTSEYKEKPLLCVSAMHESAHISTFIYELPNDAIKTALE